MPVPFANETASIEALRDGRVPAHFGSRTYPAQIDAEAGLFEAGELETGAIGFAFALTPTDPDLIAAFERQQATISADGTLARIAQTHLGSGHADPISLCDRVAPIS